MGRTLADLQKELPLIPHQIVEREAEGGRKVLTVQIGGREHTPEELSAMILRRSAAGRQPDEGRHHRPGLLRRRASGRRPATPAGSPAWTCSGSSTSRPPRRWPTGWTGARTGTVAVYDLGGGTFDCSILSHRATASSRCSARTATPTSAATTSTARSWRSPPRRWASIWRPSKTRNFCSTSATRRSGSKIALSSARRLASNCRIAASISPHVHAGRVRSPAHAAHRPRAGEVPHCAARRGQSRKGRSTRSSWSAARPAFRTSASGSASSSAAPRTRN